MSGSKAIRYAVLCAIVLHNSVHTLLMRHTRSRSVPHMYRPTEAMFFTECIKLVLCSLFVFIQMGGDAKRMVRTLYVTIVTRWRDTLRVAVLALLYTVQSNLFYIGATYLQAAPFIVTSQLKILTTALCSVFMLGTRLGVAQWSSLLILTVGVCLVQTPSDGDSESAMGYEDKMSHLFGFGVVVLACMCSGVACVWFERMLKQQTVVSIWLAVCAIPISLFGVLATDKEHMAVHGWLYGFDSTVWCMVVWYALGGLIVACVMKYSDNIVKNFAVSIAVVNSTIASMFLFDFRPGYFFVLGTACVISALFLYNLKPTTSSTSSDKRSMSSSHHVIVMDDAKAM